MKEYLLLIFFVILIISCDNNENVVYQDSNFQSEQNPIGNDSAIVLKRWDLLLSEKYFYKSALFINFCKVLINNEIYWVPDSGNFSSSQRTGYCNVINYDINIYINEKKQVCYKIRFDQLLYHNYVLKNEIDPLYNNFDELSKCYDTVLNLVNMSEKKSIRLINDYNPFISGDFMLFTRTYLCKNTDKGLVIELLQNINPEAGDFSNISKASCWIINNDDSLMRVNLPKGDPDNIVSPWKGL